MKKPTQEEEGIPECGVGFGATIIRWYRALYRSGNSRSARCGADHSPRRTAGWCQVSAYFMEMAEICR